MGRAIHRVSDSDFFFSPACNSSVPTPELFNSPRFEGFWENLKLKFDLVLIDSPPLDSLTGCFGPGIEGGRSGPGRGGGKDQMADSQICQGTDRKGRGERPGDRV